MVRITVSSMAIITIKGRVKGTVMNTVMGTVVGMIIIKLGVYLRIW